jgi:DNA-binding SARP family transcriptional activator/tetratricopeptide (TPR) repeat protein
VQLWRDGARIQLTGPKLRSVLAMLLLTPGAPVSVDRLIQVLWTDDVPAYPHRLVQHHVSLLRALLREPGLLDSSSGGYTLHAAPDSIDLHAFDALCASGRDALHANDAALAANQLRKALALWCGPALFGTTDELMRRFAPALEERRLAALGDRIDADLHLGRHLDLLPELNQLVTEHPFDERLRQWLIVALDRSGRRADAILAYHEARRLLRDEFGVEPGIELQDTYRQLLGAPSPSAISAAATVTTAQPAPETPRVPRQLPATITDFVGRAPALATLDTLLAQNRLAAVVGPAGVGKTALAVHWAHSVAARFPDGQLFANLRGYDRDEPVAAYAVIGEFLRALGVSPEDVPHDQAERAALYRTLLADRTVLVVLDNIRTTDQVRPLLPGSARAVVLMTSRDELAGLVVRDGARRIALAPVTEQEGHELLRLTLGSQRVEAEPAAACELTKLCAGLPLALRLAAERISRRPHARLATIIEELQLQAGRLDALDAAGDSAATIRATFSWSYVALPASAARLFRLLPLHPGSTIDTVAAANLVGLGKSQTRRELDMLTGVHLLTETHDGHFQMHDLLRAYALERCHAEETPSAQHAAVSRLLDGYAAAALLAMDLVDPHRHRLPATVSPTALALPELRDYDDALAWLEAQRVNLMATIRLATSAGKPEHTWQQAHTLWRYFLLGRHTDDWIASHQLAVTAAQEAGDRHVEAKLLSSLAAAYTHIGESTEAIRQYQRVLPLVRELGDARAEANAVANLGTAFHRTGNYAQAREHYLTALALFGDNELRDQAIVLGNIAGVSYLLGDYVDSAHHYQLSLTISLAIADRVTEAYAHLGLGTAHRELGRFDDAKTHLDRALELSKQNSDPYDHATCLSDLGLLSFRRGNHADACLYLHDALELSRSINDPNLTAVILNRLGDATYANAEAADAAHHYREALGIATPAGDRYQQAHAHRGMATIMQATGDTAAAAWHRHNADELSQALGLG